MAKKFLAIFIAVLLLAASLTACSDNSPETENNGENQTENNTENNTAPEEPEALSIGFLKGPTGMGAAQLMKQNADGALDVKYDIILEADPSVVTGAIIANELDIAAVPTNVAATLYNKTNQGIKIVAINTMGVLYILEKGDSVNSVADLAGKTIYATGQGSNPEYVLNHILTSNGLEPGTDVTVEYLASDELATRMAAGEFDVCMLPVPAATSVLIKNADVREALNLTDEWNAISSDGSILTQGCIIASNDVSDADIAKFLEYYSESIEYMTDEANLEDAAALAVECEIVGAAPIAKAAMAKCGMVCITGADAMRDYLAGYYQMLYAAAPNAIGGSVPDDGFYWEN